MPTAPRPFRRKNTVFALLLMAGLGLAACTAAPGNPTPITPCGLELGKEKAAELVNRCRAVSPATNPPCHAANSCVTIQSEIDRSCALMGSNPPAECGVRP